MGSKQIWSNQIPSNLVILMDAKSGDGIETWITLKRKYMEILEQDPELLEFALLDSGIGSELWYREDMNKDIGNPLQSKL